MELVFTVGIVFISAILLTVNVRDRKKIKYLRNQVLELEQLLEMALIYGKETEESEAKAREEASKKGLDNTNEPAN